MLKTTLNKPFKTLYQKVEYQCTGMFEGEDVLFSTILKNFKVQSLILKTNLLKVKIFECKMCFNNSCCLNSCP